MQNTEDEDFNKFWKEIGSKIDGKFALAVVTWDASKNAFSKPVEPIKYVPEKNTGESVTGTKEVILTYKREEYVESDECSVIDCCKGCRFEHDDVGCSHVIKITQGHCVDNKIIWVKKEKV